MGVAYEAWYWKPAYFQWKTVGPSPISTYKWIAKNLFVAQGEYVQSAERFHNGAAHIFPAYIQQQQAGLDPLQRQRKVQLRGRVPD